MALAARVWSLVVDEVTGQPCRIVGLTMDVTERRAAEEALRASEERLGLAFDSGDDGLWGWNVTDDQIWISDRWLDKLGFSKDNLTAAIFGPTLSTPKSVRSLPCSEREY